MDKFWEWMEEKHIIHTLLIRRVETPQILIGYMIEYIINTGYVTNWENKFYSNINEYYEGLEKAIYQIEKLES